MKYRFVTKEDVYTNGGGYGVFPNREAALFWARLQALVNAETPDAESLSNIGADAFALGDDHEFSDD